MMSGYVCGDWKVDFFRSIACYDFTINNCGKIQQGSNGGSDYISSQFKAIKDTSAFLTINKMLQFFVGKVGRFKNSDAVRTWICHGSEDDMVLNPTLYFLSAINHCGWNFRVENRILIYLNFSKHILYAERGLQGEHGVTEMIYTPNISAFDDENNRQIVTNFARVIFNTQVNVLKHYGRICTFIAGILAFLLHHNKSLKLIAGEENMITVPLL